MDDRELEKIKNASVDQLIEIMRKAAHEDPRYDNEQRAIRDAARAQLDSVLYKSLTDATSTLASHTQELAGSTAQIQDAATKISEAQGKLVEATNTLDTTVGGGITLVRTYRDRRLDRIRADRASFDWKPLLPVLA